MPTETIYGAFGLLQEKQARKRLKEIRGSGAAKPLTVHLGRREEAKRFLGDVSELGERMMRKLWPGPVGLTFDVPAERRAAVATELGVSEAEIYEGGSITL